MSISPAAFVTSDLLGSPIFEDYWLATVKSATAHQSTTAFARAFARLSISFVRRQAHRFERWPPLSPAAHAVAALLEADPRSQTGRRMSLQGFESGAQHHLEDNKPAGDREMISADPLAPARSTSATKPGAPQARAIGAAGETSVIPKGYRGSPSVANRGRYPDLACTPQVETLSTLRMRQCSRSALGRKRKLVFRLKADPTSPVFDAPEAVELHQRDAPRPDPIRTPSSAGRVKAASEATLLRSRSP